MAEAEQPGVLPDGVSVPALDITPRSVLTGSGPRFARDAFGPALSFYVAWKLAGLWAGIAVATVVSVGLWWFERQRDSKNSLAWISLCVVAVQALVGVIADDARAFFAPQVLAGAAWSIAMLGSVALGKPLAGILAGEIYPFPDEVRASDTFRRIFGRISIVWGVVLGLRAVMRLAMLSFSVEGFLLTSLATGVPITAATLTWSVTYAVRGFRKSEEWGWAFVEAEPPPAPT